MIKKITALILALLFCVCVVGCGNKSNTDNKQDSSEDLYKVTHRVQIVVKEHGTIELELYGNLAPITVENFVGLVKKGFYDGLTFHRVINGFMIQGGDPEGNGMGGSGENIKGEFAVNGVQNNLSHERGVISMARGGYSYDSASSQFFIMHADNAGLDGQYAAFGRVTSGIETVDSVAQKTPVTDNNGTVLAKNQPIIESIKIIE